MVRAWVLGNKIPMQRYNPDIKKWYIWERIPIFNTKRFAIFKDDTKRILKHLGHLPSQKILISGQITRLKNIAEKLDDNIYFAGNLLLLPLNIRLDICRYLTQFLRKNGTY